MKKKHTVVIAIVLVFIVGILISGKYAYDYFVNMAIDQSFSALTTELNSLPIETKTPADTTSTQNVTGAENAQSIDAEKDTQKNIAQEKPVGNKLSEVIDKNDKDRAMQIALTVVSAGDIPRLMNLAVSRTPEAKAELKGIYNKLSSAQKSELLALYGKYKQYLK